jgi:integrase
MANVFERSGRWYLRYKDGRGRWVQRVSKARTKTEARRLANDVERQAERQRLGLEAAPPRDGNDTVLQLLQRWAGTRVDAPSAESDSYSIAKHFARSAVGRLPASSLRAPDVENFLAEKRAEGLAPETVNHIRGFLSRAFNVARRRGWWTGPNPVTDVRPLQVPRRLAPDYLRFHEVPAVLAALAPRWRPLFATAIYTGLRRGELRALRKTDVDLERRLLTVARSGDRDTTKGGHADVVPIAAELVPFLAVAMTSSPSEFVFVGLDGEGMRGHMRPEKVLRSAMARAGIVEGYIHVCRRRGCTFKESAAAATLRRCPVHGAKLWPKPKVRKTRFHDLRHTTASLLMQAGAPIHVVQKVLRHRDPRMTANVYGHLAPDYLQREIDRLSFGISGLEAPEQEPFAALVLQPPPTGTRAPKKNRKFPTTSDAWLARSTGLEPVTSGVTGRRSNQLN